jgi:hypothetical protein
MAQESSPFELAEFRDLLARLESGELVLKQGGNDVSAREIAVLKREIAALEKVIGRLRGSSGD